MEKYLKEQYDVFEDENYLASEGDIVDYFKDCGSEYMECGQGFFQDEASVICKISDKFYDVTIFAEMMSAKQDVGDRLYWVDYIKHVTYEEIDKPLPKDILAVTYNLSITADQKSYLEYLMTENNIEF